MKIFEEGVPVLKFPKKRSSARRTARPHGQAPRPFKRQTHALRLTQAMSPWQSLAEVSIKEELGQAHGEAPRPSERQTHAPRLTQAMSPRQSLAIRQLSPSGKKNIAQEGTTAIAPLSPVMKNIYVVILKQNTCWVFSKIITCPVWEAAARKFTGRHLSSRTGCNRKHRHGRGLTGKR